MTTTGAPTQTAACFTVSFRDGRVALYNDWAMASLVAQNYADNTGEPVQLEDRTVVTFHPAIPKGAA